MPSHLSRLFIIGIVGEGLEPPFHAHQARVLPVRRTDSILVHSLVSAHITQSDILYVYHLPTSPTDHMRLETHARIYPLNDTQFDRGAELTGIDLVLVLAL